MPSAQSQSGYVLQGDKAAACATYQIAITAAAEKGLEGQKAYVYLTVQYAQFLLVVYKDVEGARSAYSAALEKLPGSQTLWEGAIHLQQIVGATVCLCSPRHCFTHACTVYCCDQVLAKVLQCSLSLVINCTASSPMMSTAACSCKR